MGNGWKNGCSKLNAKCRHLCSKVLKTLKKNRADSLGLAKKPRYRIEQRDFIIEQYLKNNESFSCTAKRVC